MRVIVERIHLANAMNAVAGAVDRKVDIPILSHIELVAENDELRVTATNLDMEASAICAAEIDEPGSICLPAQTFEQMVKSAPDGGQIEIRPDGQVDHGFIVSSGNRRAEMLSLPAVDFPHLRQKPEDAHSLTVTAGTLQTVLRRVAYAAETKHVDRPYLTGVFMHGESYRNAFGAGTGTSFTALDGRRMASTHLVDLPYPPDAPGIIIPHTSVNYLIKTTAERGGDVDISFSDRLIRVDFGDVIFVSKLIDGTYPDYVKAISQLLETPITVDVNVTKSAVGFAIQVGGNKARRTEFEAQTKSLSIQARREDGATGLDQVKVLYEGEPIRFACDGSYVVDALTQIDSGDVELHVPSPPATIRIHERGDDHSLHLIMCMNP
ncbi:MAG: DNA polymerase III subunit beta [Pseudomonadota bacterium]